MNLTEEQRKSIAERLTIMANPRDVNNPTMEVLNVAAMLIYPGVKLVHAHLPEEFYPRVKDNMKIGTYVKYNALTGSTGKVIAMRDIGPPFKGNYGFYVEWVYGRDVAGDIIKERTGLLHRDVLIIITEAEYIKVRDGEGLGS